MIGSVQAGKCEVVSPKGETASLTPSCGMETCGKKEIISTTPPPSLLSVYMFVLCRKNQMSRIFQDEHL